MFPPRAATIVDIAAKLKLSPMTVSRALTGNPEISEKTRQRVLDCASSLGYQPNRWARSLKARRSSLIGIIIPDIAHSFFAEITCGVEEVVEPAGYDLLLCHSRSDPEREKKEMATLAGSRVEGLIIASVQPEKLPEPLLQITGRGIPCVLVDRFFPKAPLASVRVDDRATGRLATRHLLDLGHERIAHIQGPPVSTASLRKRGYLDALRRAGIARVSEYLETGDFDIDGGRQAMHRLLRTSPRPSAVFAANDPMAIGAIYACREAGLRVPEDVSIVGAGNIEGPHHPNPFLTTMDWPRQELGRTAAGILLDAIRNHPSSTVVTKVFEPALVVRQSTQRFLVHLKTNH